MTVKIYKTKKDQLNETPIIFNNVLKIVDQTDENELDIYIKSSVSNLARWERIENRNKNWLIIIEE